MCVLHTHRVVNVSIAHRYGSQSLVCRALPFQIAESSDGVWTTWMCSCALVQIEQAHQVPTVTASTLPNIHSFLGKE